MNGTLAGIIAILMWSSTAALVLLTGDVPGLFLTSISFFLGFAVLTIRQYVMKENISAYWTRPFGDYLFVTVGIGVYTALLYLSFKWVAPFEANTLNYLWPILLVFFAGIFHEKSLTFNGVLGFILGFAGSIILFFPRNSEAFFSNFEWGHAFALSAAIIWAAYSVFARKRHYPQGIMAPMFFFSALICLGLHLAFEQTIWPQEWGQWLAVLALGVLRISYSFWDYGMKNGNVILLASLSYFIPLISAFFLLLLGFGPTDSLVGWGAALVVSGCLVVNADQILKLFQNKRKTG